MYAEHNLKKAFSAARRFDWDHVCNQSDDQGRYSYRNQPAVCRWNCEKLAEALAPVLPPGARNELAIFDQEYERCAPLCCHTCCLYRPSEGLIRGREDCALCLASALLALWVVSTRWCCSSGRIILTTNAALPYILELAVPILMTC